jgi:hypothetical protein
MPVTFHLLHLIMRKGMCMIVPMSLGSCAAGAQNNSHCSHLRTLFVIQKQSKVVMQGYPCSAPLAVASEEDPLSIQQ